MSKNLLIHTWTAYYSEGKYYLPYMHWIYLNEIKQYFSKISLIVPVGKINDTNDLILMDFPNVEIQILKILKFHLFSSINYCFHDVQHHLIIIIEGIKSRKSNIFGHQIKHIDFRVWSQVRSQIEVDGRDYVLLHSQCHRTSRQCSTQRECRHSHPSPPPKTC